MSKLVTLTRKIELRINTTNKDEKNDHYKTLKAWRDIACSGANMAISAMYTTLKGEGITFLDKKLATLKGRSFDFEDQDAKAIAKLSKEENKEIYKEIEAEKKAFFESSEVAYYYGLLAEYYKGRIKTAILSCIANQVASDFATDKSDYLRHNVALRTYKKNMPIPFTSQSVRHVRRSADEKGKEYKDFCFMLFGIPFRTNFGADRSNNYFLMNEALSRFFLPQWVRDNEEVINVAILEMRDREPSIETLVLHKGEIDLSITYQVVANTHHYNVHAVQGDKEVDFIMKPMKPKKDAGGNSYIPGYKLASNYKLCDSKLQIKEEQFDNDQGGKSERTKLYLLASFQFESKGFNLDADKSALCELDPETPIMLTIGNKKFKIGSKEEFNNRRLGIQGAYRQTQKNLKYTNGGRGRKHKLGALDKYSEYEKDVVINKIHNYSAELIKICLANNCKYIYLRIPKKPTDNKTDEQKYLMRNWSYGQMQTKIEWKAGRVGIEVATVADDS